MLIRCPNCSTAFNVPTAAIGEAGRKVKCTKCANIWFQEPLKQKDLGEFLNIDEKLKPLKETFESKLPSKIEKIFTKKSVSLLVLAFTIFLISCALNFNGKIPFVRKLFLMQPTSGLSFSDFSMVKSIEDNKYKFAVTGYLLNTSNVKKDIPKIVIHSITKGGSTLQRQKIKLESETIEPKSRVRINKTITEISGNTDKLIISIGNPWERFFE